jgi:hypothetical protein
MKARKVAKLTGRKGSVLPLDTFPYLNFNGLLAQYFQRSLALHESCRKLKHFDIRSAELSKWKYIMTNLDLCPSTLVKDSRRTKASLISFQTPTLASPSPVIDWAHQRAQRENIQALMLVPDQPLRLRLVASSAIFAGKRPCRC